MMASPTQGMKGQPQAGLAALAQPAQAPKGMPSGNMQQIMARAKSMSDAQLADILSGKSMDVPQYVAMTEAMGRKSLRNAVQGQQAMQQAKQPSIKDKFLAEDAKEQMAQMMAQAPQMGGQGISALPAPNMDSMGMAGGGIIAFEEGGDVEERGVFPQPSNLDKKLWKSLKEKFSEWNQPWGKTVNASPAEIRGVLTGKNVKQPTPIEDTPVVASAPALPAVDTGAKPDALGRFIAGNEAPPAAAPVQAPITGVGTAPSAQPFSIPSFESLQGTRSQDYLSKLEGLSDKQRAGIAQIKKEGGGEALMQMAAGILSRPTLGQGLAAGLPLVASTSAATRKEIQGQNAAANEYDMNLAKAREAAEKGDMALALQYQQIADQAKYRAETIGLQRAQLGQEPNEVRTLRAIMADPKLAALYKGGKGANTISRETALKEYNDLIIGDYRAKKQFPTFESYYSSLSNSTMGGGTDLQAQAAAELARRSK